MKRIAALVLALVAAASLAAQGSAASRIDALFVKEFFENGMEGFQSKEGLRGLYDECAAIDPDYWRTAYLRMLYEDAVAEDRGGILSALEAADAAWAAYSADPRNLEAFDTDLKPAMSDLASEAAYRAYFDRLLKQLNAVRILGLKGNLLEAMDERAEAEAAFAPLIESGSSLARYEGLERLFWLRIKFLSLAEAEGLLAEAEAARNEAERDLAMNLGIDDFYTSSYKRYYANGFGNEVAILHGYAYDLERSMDEYRSIIERDRAWAGAMGYSYQPDLTLLSNVQLLRLSTFDFDGLDENHVEDDSFYGFLQARYEALLSRGRPLEARAAIRASRADPRYLTEGMKRLFRGQASLLAGDARSAISHLEYAAGYREVFRDISYTLSNYQARVWSELASACAAERRLIGLEGRPALGALPLRAKEFYYRFLLAANLRAHPDYASLFSPFMNVRDMSMSPYASAETLASLDRRGASRRLAEIEAMDRRREAEKYYRLFEAEMALSSPGGLPRAAELLEGDPESGSGVERDERLYLAMAWSARARLASRRRDRERAAEASLAAYRIFPSWAATRGLHFEFAELKIDDGVGGKEGELIAKRVRKAARKWRVSWRKGRDDLPAPILSIAAEGTGEGRRFALSVRVDDPGSPYPPAESGEGAMTVVYAQDLKRGSYPSWVFRSIFGIRSEDDEATAPSESADADPSIEDILGR